MKHVNPLSSLSTLPLKCDLKTLGVECPEIALYFKSEFLLFLFVLKLLDFAMNNQQLKFFLFEMPLFFIYKSYGYNNSFLVCFSFFCLFQKKLLRTSDLAEMNLHLQMFFFSTPVPLLRSLS